MPSSIVEAPGVVQRAWVVGANLNVEALGRATQDCVDDEVLAVLGVTGEALRDERRRAVDGSAGGRLRPMNLRIACVAMGGNTAFSTARNLAIRVSALHRQV